MKNIRVFYLNFFLFLEVKYYIYLNRHVFVMFCCRKAAYTQYFRDLKPGSVMCIWEATAYHKIPVHILYI